MICIVGLGKKHYHSWIPMAKKQNTNKLFQFFSRLYPGINDTEFEILIKTNTEKDVKNLCKDYALQDDEVDDIVKQFKNAKNDVSNGQD